jgi:hypothetical protein
MTEPRRWPVNANWARERAIGATEDAIDELIEVMGALGENNPAKAVGRIKRAVKLMNYVVRVLIYAKFGEKAGELPEEPAQEAESQ